jgi:hypothetical protein
MWNCKFRENNILSNKRPCAVEVWKAYMLGTKDTSFMGRGRNSWTIYIYIYIYTFLYMDVECIKCINVELAAMQFIAKTCFWSLVKQRKIQFFPNMTPGSKEIM